MSGSVKVSEGLKREWAQHLLGYNIEQAMQARFDAGRQSGLKEQLGISQVNVIEALAQARNASKEKGIQIGIQMGIRMAEEKDYCCNGHPPVLRRLASPGVWMCDTCRQRAYEQLFTEGPSTDKTQATRETKHRPIPARTYIEQQRSPVAMEETQAMRAITPQQMQELLRKVEP